MEFEQLLHEIEKELIAEKGISLGQPFVDFYDVFVPDYVVKNGISVVRTKRMHDEDPFFKIRLDRSFRDKTYIEQKSILKCTISKLLFV